MNLYKHSVIIFKKEAHEMIEKIKKAEPEELNDILLAVLERYREVFPDWEIMTLSLEKAVDKNEQLDRVIDLLEHMKEK